MASKKLSCMKVSQMMGVSYSTLVSWDNSGKFVAHRHSKNNRRYYTLDQVEAHPDYQNSKRNEFQGVVTKMDDPFYERFMGLVKKGTYGSKKSVVARRCIEEALDGFSDEYLASKHTKIDSYSQLINLEKSHKEISREFGNLKDVLDKLVDFIFTKSAEDSDKIDEMMESLNGINTFFNQLKKASGAPVENDVKEDNPEDQKQTINSLLSTAN